ncbi:PREDICTED: uncharacterized protein LOC108556561 [Nicrophorus vespilloides]|uniref:Uncharacterized protein LOC108556561 n=1 Tax=Nicrophorus vespilloides TaxID=110193 RepID=A0ABM1M0X0_NICVS|nr:PREDICTED: uncharacterized protein LOC108556561 [Nicrophorus vespilloides]
MSKRSSILKPQRTRNAFEDVNMDSPGPKDGDTGRFSRKVRFSSNFVKTYVTEDEGKDTIWDNTYEEAIEDTAQSTSTEVLHVTNEKENVLDNEQSFFEVEDDKENDLNFSVNTSLFKKDTEKFTVFNDEENYNNHNQSLIDLSIKSKIEFSNYSQTSFKPIDVTPWFPGRDTMVVENILKVDDIEMTDSYTKAYEQSNHIIFEKQQNEFSDNTRDCLNITPSIPLQYDEEVLLMETSQNEIEFTENHSMCLNGNELEFTGLMLENPKKHTEKIVYQDDALNDSKLKVGEATGDTRHFLKQDMEFSFQVNDKITAVNTRETILFSSENNDLEFTEKIIHKDQVEKCNDDMEFTVEVAQMTGKDSRKTILFSPEKNDLEFTEEISNKLNNEKRSRKTILFSSENNDLDITEQIGNKMFEEQTSRKTIHFPMSEDDMEFSIKVPQLAENNSRKTILFSSDNNDLEFTEKINNVEFDKSLGSRKTADISKTILFSDKNNILEFEDEVVASNIVNRKKSIEIKKYNVEESEKIVHFPKADGDMEFTQQLSYFGEKILDRESAKTILFSAENDDLELTEKIEVLQGKTDRNYLIEENGMEIAEQCDIALNKVDSRKTIHFPKSCNDMEVTMELPSFIGNRAEKIECTRKTILFSSDNNGMELTEKIDFKNGIEKKSDVAVTKSYDDKILEVGKQINRKTILFSDENNDMEVTERIDTNLMKGKSVIEIDVPLNDIFVKSSAQVIEETDKTHCCTSALPCTELIYKETSVEKISLPNTNINVESNNHCLTVKKLKENVENSSRTKRKTILFGSENDDMEITQDFDLNLGNDQTKEFIKSEDVAKCDMSKTTDEVLDVNTHRVEEKSKKQIPLVKTKIDLEILTEKKMDNNRLKTGRKTILFSSENDGMEVESINLKNTIVDESKIPKFRNTDHSTAKPIHQMFDSKTTHTIDKSTDHRSALGFKKERVTSRKLDETNILHCSSDTMEVTKTIDLNVQQDTTDRNNLIHDPEENGMEIAEQCGIALNKVDSRKTIHFPKSSNDMEFTMELPSFIGKKGERKECSRKTILFSSDNNGMEMTEKIDCKNDSELTKSYYGKTLELGKQVNRKTILFSNENNGMEVTERMDTNLTKEKSVIKTDMFVKSSTQTSEEAVKNQCCTSALPNKTMPLSKSYSNKELSQQSSERKTELFSSLNDDLHVTKLNSTRSENYMKNSICNPVDLSEEKKPKIYINLESDNHCLTGKTGRKTILFVAENDDMEVTKTFDLSKVDSLVVEECFNVSREESIMLEESLISKVDKLNENSKETEIVDLEMVDDVMLVDRFDENISKNTRSIPEMESSNCDLNNIQGTSYIDVDEDKMKCEDDTYIEISSTCLQGTERDVSSCDSSTRKRTLESVHKSCKKFINASNLNSSAEMSSEISFSESCGDFSRTANLTPRVSLSNFEATVNCTLKLDQTTILQERKKEPDDPLKVINHDLNDILRRIGPIRTETKNLEKSNRILADFRNEMRKYEALLTYIRSDLEAQQKEDVNPTDKPFFETLVAAPKTIREEVKEKQKLCNGSFSAEFPKERTCEVKALFGTILIRMEFDETKGLVQQTEIVNKLSLKTTPIIRYVHRLLLDKINDMKTSLGNSFSILTLLDYIHLHQGKVLRQRQEFEEMCKIYYNKRRHDIEIDENFIVNWHIVEVRLGFSCIVRMDPSRLSSEHIVIQSEIGYFNNCEILELVTGCTKSLSGIRMFVDRVSSMLVERGEEEHTAYLAKYSHLFS